MRVLLIANYRYDRQESMQRYADMLEAGLKMVPEGSILHFVGSPKPWDIGGGILHSGYRKWSAAAKKGGYRSLAFWIKNGFPMLKRAWIIKRSVARWLLRKLKG